MAIQIQHDDDHTVEVLDEVAMKFMALMTHRLNTALRAQGVPSSEQRQEICEQFLFGLAYEWDAGWFQDGPTRYFPKVCFLERAQPQEDEDLGAVTVAHIPNEASSWHEYACGVVMDYFGAGEAVEPPIRTGSYERENP